MSDNQPIDNFWEEWNLDPMLSSGQQLYASGATGSGIVLQNISPPSACLSIALPCNLIPGELEASSTDPHNPITFNENICYTCSPPQTFKRLGDLTRHRNEKHNPTTASKYLCPINLCAKGIPGEGFGRMHHLVSHLKSKKHGMPGNEARYLAHKHNLPKSKGLEKNGGGGVQTGEGAQSSWTGEDTDLSRTVENTQLSWAEDA